MAVTDTGRPPGPDTGPDTGPLPIVGAGREGLDSALRAGRTATVRVPATSANLGPGFDSLGLALGIHDVVAVRLAARGFEVTVEGQGASEVPLTERHLVARAVRAGFDHLGLAQPGLRLTCRNVIPHGRGLGSSAAAVVAGLVLARGCLADPGLLDDATVLALATAFEGHPDNAAAALLGGATVSWISESGVPAAERIDVRADLAPVVCVPAVELATHTARQMLPDTVPHRDAAFNAGRSALLVHALAHRPDLLLEATRDRLHQAQRAPAMPATAQLIDLIRQHGGAAVVSGAGPSVLTLTATRPAGGPGSGPGPDPVDAALDRLQELAGPIGETRWTVLRPGVDTVGALLATDGD